MTVKGSTHGVTVSGVVCCVEGGVVLNVQDKCYT